MTSEMPIHPGAYLSGANLGRANLRGADLRGADLGRANLGGADLGGADLRGAMGNMQEVFSAQLDIWAITWTREMLFIGCQGWPIVAWWSFGDEEIAEMDRRALEWWQTWKPVLGQMIANTINGESMES